MRRGTRWLLFVLVMLLAVACGPAATEEPAADEATSEAAAVVPGEATAEATEAPFTRQAEGETLVFAVGRTIFTVPNEDNRWAVANLQGDRLIPTEEGRAYNVTLSLINGVDDFEARVQTLAGEDETTFSQAGETTYAVVERAAGPEYYILRGDQVLVGIVFIPDSSPLPAPERDQILNTLLNTSISMMD